MLQWKTWQELNGTKKHGSGPTGKMKQLFEAASRLARSQQQKLAAIIDLSLLITRRGESRVLTKLLGKVSGAKVHAMFRPVTSERPVSVLRLVVEANKNRKTPREVFTRHTENYRTPRWQPGR